MAIIAIPAILVVACAINNLVSMRNITEFDALDRMRYTAIQMTIMDLQSNQRANDSIDRLTTLEVENLYRNITQ